MYNPRPADIPEKKKKLNKFAEEIITQTYFLYFYGPLPKKVVHACSRGNIHFDMSGYFVTYKFDITGVDCICLFIR